MDAGARLLTAEDLLRGPFDERGELWDGRFVVRDPSGGWSPALGVRLITRLSSAPQADRDGWVLDASAGYVVARDPDRVLSPDVSFVSRVRVPRLPERGFVEGPPELAIEIRSSGDTWTATVEKGGIWIAHGARVVWCVDPIERLVAILRPGEAPLLRRAGEQITAQPVLDLTLAVRTLFEGLD